MKFQRGRAPLAYAAVALGLGWLASCADRSPIKSEAHAPADSLQDRIAHGLLQASPPSDPSDLIARDTAADRLAHFVDLQNAIGEQILWGGYEDRLGYDPSVYKLTAFNAFVWAKLYLSTFMFSGPYEVRQEGKRTVLEISVKFRGGLDAGDYPYPFWHSAKKWQAYLDARALLLVFEGDQLVAALRKSVRDPALPLAEKAWDKRWHWEDAQGHPEPRVALYQYLLSPGNPNTARLETSYRKLEQRFRAHECLSCHSPDNPARPSKLFMLNYPNQALSGRHELLKVLNDDTMPPLDPNGDRKPGLHDDGARTELLRLAEDFATAGDAALSYERAHGPATAPRP
jgi:hypothetical protein